MTDSAFCLYTNPSRVTIPLIRPHQCDSEGCLQSSIFSTRKGICRTGRVHVHCRCVRLCGHVFRGRSQLSTFMKAYTAYARGRGSGTTVRFPPENQHLILITDNVTFEALFLMSKCTQSDVLWTQTVAPHRGFCMAAQRRFRSTYADYSSQIAPNRE